MIKGHAEDHYKVIGLFGTVSPPGTTNTLLTQETTPLEPGTVDHKMYVRGIGTVLEQTEKGTQRAQRARLGHSSALSDDSLARGRSGLSETNGDQLLDERLGQRLVDGEVQRALGHRVSGKLVA